MEFEYVPVSSLVCRRPDKKGEEEKAKAENRRSATGNEQEPEHQTHIIPQHTSDFSAFPIGVMTTVSTAGGYTKDFLASHCAQQ
jgi:hypothetical protein